MIALSPLLRRPAPTRVLCIGAHSDDLEIGCAGTMLAWLAAGCALEVTWVVLSASRERSREASRSAGALLRRAAKLEIILGDFRDGYMPAQYVGVKSFLESLKTRPSPDLVFTHRIEDRHQDHRLLGELTWNTWRDQVILEYEIAKYEGDLGIPNVYVPLTVAQAQRKAKHLVRHFASQRSKTWFDSENFLALARLRGTECRSPSGLAEAFHVRKLVLGSPLIEGSS